MALDEGTLDWLAAHPQIEGPPDRGCATCGFLSKRWIDHTQVMVVEAPEHARATGDMWYSNTHHRPVCFVRAADLGAEIQQLQDRIAPNSVSAQIPSGATPAEAKDAARRLFAWSRKCPEWYPWTPGFTPQEHRRERDMLRIEAERAALQQRLADMDRNTQLRLAELRAESEESAAKRERYSFLTFVTLGLIGVLLAAFAVGATLYPNETRRLFEAAVQWFARLVGPR